MWHDPSFYILISFLLFLWFVGRPFYAKLSTQLKDRATTIERQIKEVEALHAEAQAILKQQKQSLEFAEKEMNLLEKESHARVEKIHKKHEALLEKLQEQSSVDLKKEMQNP